MVEYFGRSHYSIEKQFRCTTLLFNAVKVGLSTISFALQKEGGQKDAASIPNAVEIVQRR